MKIRINVKGISNRKSRILQRILDYPDWTGREITVEDFLTETVRLTVREYNAGKESGKILQLFSPEALEDLAAAGKVSYGDPMDGCTADEERAVANALQCWEDGLAALFVDGKRYTDRKEVLPLREDSEVTFVRLTFLAGRMW